ncbi:MAG: hypothetical protein H6821_06655 [Planctomycetaceae bacterium]|nr:hypothetical protein [Planctomycetaceae bacterium]
MSFHKPLQLTTIALVLSVFVANFTLANDIRFATDSDNSAEDLTSDLASFDLCGGTCRCNCCPDPWVVSREPICCRSHLGGLTNLATSIGNGCNFKMPFSGGAWHWFHQSLNGSPGGYGIPDLRGTYFWYLYADPEYATAAGNKIGGHMELRLRERDQFRSFTDDQVWTWELYGYLHNDQLGTLKVGQLFNRFGLFWDGVFFGNAAYFDGLKLDADYGVSWEKTTEIDDCLSVDTYVQFFFHEDQCNGSFTGADAESVAGYTEKNTGVARLVPIWTRADGSQVAIGASAMVGQIDSQIALPDETVWSYGMDVTYTKGRWKAFAEGSQTFGVRNPVNYVSGGASDELTNFLAGIHYTRGAITYRCSYSNSIYKNPDGVLHMLLAGTTIMLSPDVDLYIEYVNQRVDGATLPGRNGDFFNGIEWVINWHF